MSKSTEQGEKDSGGGEGNGPLSHILQVSHKENSLSFHQVQPNNINANMCKGTPEMGAKLIWIGRCDKEKKAP